MGLSLLHENRNDVYYILGVEILNNLKNLIVAP